MLPSPRTIYKCDITFKSRGTHIAVGVSYCADRHTTLGENQVVSNRIQQIAMRSTLLSGVAFLFAFTATNPNRG
jgi:hypothetical protein